MWIKTRVTSHAGHNSGRRDCRQKVHKMWPHGSTWGGVMSRSQYSGTANNLFTIFRRNPQLIRIFNEFAHSFINSPPGAVETNLTINYKCFNHNLQMFLFNCWISSIKQHLRLWPSPYWLRQGRCYVLASKRTFLTLEREGKWASNKHNVELKANVYPNILPSSTNCSLQ